MEKENIKPYGVNVLVKISLLEEEKDGIYKGKQRKSTKTDIEYYYGEVETLGENATEKEQCPELKVGDKICFSQFAGYHVETKEDFCKVIRGHDIVAIFEDMNNITEDNVKPTGERILVKIINEDIINEDGIYNNSK